MAPSRGIDCPSLYLGECPQPASTPGRLFHARTVYAPAMPFCRALGIELFGCCKKFLFFGAVWSGRRDLNSRPLVPQTSALTGLRHAPTGTARTIGLSATVDLISVSARMSQPYCKRPKQPLSRSRFLPFRARSASMFSNRWASKTRSRWVGCSMAHPARLLQRPGRPHIAGLVDRNQLTTARISAPGSWRTKSTRAVF